MNSQLPIDVIVILSLSLVTVLAARYLRHRVGDERLRANHEVAGFVYAVIGAIFAVNAALTIDTVHDEFIQANREIAQEAGQLVAVQRLVDWFGPDEASQLKSLLGQYARTVIAEEWVSSSQRRVSEGTAKTAEICRDIWRQVCQINVQSANQQAAYAEMLARLAALENSRDVRLNSHRGQMPGAIWLLQVLGGIITIGFTLFFTMENRYTHTMIVVMVSILVWSSILLSNVVHYPFDGFVIVRPEPLIRFLEGL